MWTINTHADLEAAYKLKNEFSPVIHYIKSSLAMAEEIEGFPLSPSEHFSLYFGGEFIIIDADSEIYRHIPIWGGYNHQVEWTTFDGWEHISACGKFIALFFATNNSGGPTLFVPISIAKRSRITKLAQFAESVEMAANEIRIDDNTLRVTRFNPIKGQNQTKDLNITPEQREKYQRGTLIQNALGHLSANDREFIITGIGDDDDWDSMFTEEEKQ